MSRFFEFYCNKLVNEAEARKSNRDVEELKQMWIAAGHDESVAQWMANQRLEPTESQPGQPHQTGSPQEIQPRTPSSQVPSEAGQRRGGTGRYSKWNPKEGPRFW